MGGLLLCWLAARAMLFELPPGLLPQRLEAARTIVGQVHSPLERRAPVTSGSEHLVEASAASVYLTAPKPHRLADAVTIGERSTRPEGPIGIREPLAERIGGNPLRMAERRGVAGPLVAAPTIKHGEPARSQPARHAAGTATARTRWSGDAWLAWRAGTSGLIASGSAVPVYGASQAGAVLRFELAPSSRLRPAAYLRAVRALDTREGDVAAGIAIRPLGSLPVTLHGEGRLARRGDRLEMRPAGFASAGIDDVPLVAGFAARGYAQAGYVGGRDATAFADGSLVVGKTLWTGPDKDFSAGAGAWGGAQRDTGRLDMGPTASLRIRMGGGSARLNADYRFRVAGNAAPASGAAVTLSAGF